MPIDPITKPVTWHPGGAQVDPETGEPVPWPWGCNWFSPKLFFVSADGGIAVSELAQSSWSEIYCYRGADETRPPRRDEWKSNPGDLEPPTTGGANG